MSLHRWRDRVTNQQMTAGRYLRWHKARVKVAWINAKLSDGLNVYICTYTKTTKLSLKHANMVKATKSGAYMQRGKAWDCIDGCKLIAQ